MKKNKRVILIGFSAIAVLLVSSCLSFSGFNPGSSNPTNSNYEVIGNVSENFSSHSLFAIISWGDNKLNALERLREKAADMGADDVINISVEDNIIAVFYGAYLRTKFVIKGVAIKYN